MSGFFFAFLAAMAASLGARDQILLVQLTRAQGARPALLLTALVAVGAASALAAWAGGRMLADLAGPARAMVAALALALAGGEMLVFAPRRRAEEPTRSLFAAFVVLFAQQMTDAARLLILAIAVAAAAPLSAGLGGTIGSAAVLVAAWLFPERAGPGLRPARRIVGGVLAGLAGLYIAAKLIA